MEPVAPLDRPPAGPGGGAAHPHRDLVRRTGQHPQVLEAGEPSLEAGRVVAPHHPPQVERLVEPITAVAEALPQGGVLALRPADAHPDGQPATGQLVEAGQRVGQLEGGALGYHQNAGAESDLGGERRRPRERDDRVEQVRRGVVLGGGLDDVVADPQPGEAPLLGQPGGPCDGVRTTGTAELGEVDADVEHRQRLASRSRPCPMSQGTAAPLGQMYMPPFTPMTWPVM